VNVGELEDLLAFLPRDMPVHIAGGSGCSHVGEVDKQAARRVDPKIVAAFRAVTIVDGRYPPALVLRNGRAPLWMKAWADDVPFEVSGRWPRKPLR
jgi:hypothetical protein